MDVDIKFMVSIKKIVTAFITIIFLSFNSAIHAENLKIYTKKAQEAPEDEASAMLLHDESDEIDKEIERYFKQLSSSSNVDVDFEKLKKLSRNSDHPEDEIKSNRIVFSNVSRNQNSDFLNHKVTKGDTLWNIGKRYRIDPSAIIKHNPDLSNRPLYIGEEIIIVKSETETPVYKPVNIRHRIRKGDTLSHIAQRYNVSIGNLTRWNRISRKTVLIPGRTLLISKVQLSSKYRYRPYFTYPMKTGRVTSRFGRRRNPFARHSRQFHKGLDIGAPIGTPFYAAREGVVILSGRFRGYGNCIFIRHTNGYVSIYAHNKVNLVKRGDVVKRQQLIGKVGRTGMATGPHLHFEIRDKTVPINPQYALTLKEVVNKNIAMKLNGKSR
ncbi:MAG: peptidoglycan DD-metalloendopeptidase family protein [Spirochaetia bacterium]|nr:peptidoglycan DD-metalloendopeptidase family protein [Spirochaetia bacterium]